MEPFNRDVEVGKEIFRVMKAGGQHMLPYRDFVKKWEHLIDWDRFDYEDGETDMHEALLLAVHGFGSDWSHAILWGFVTIAGIMSVLAMSFVIKVIVRMVGNYREE